MSPRIAVISLSFVLAGATLWAEAGAVLRLRADSWMPFNGEPGSEMPGYTIEILQEIFGPKGVALDYETMPWTEALAAARAGEIEAVVGANKEEAAGLVLPGMEVGVSKVCLMTRRNSTWQYQNVLSFRGVKLGVIEGYSYWPGLDRYLADQKPGTTAVVVASGDESLADLLNLLDAGDIEVLAETESVLLWELRGRGKKSTDYRVVYRHEPDPIYVAFAPTATGRAYAKILEDGLQAMRESGRLRTLLRRYGLSEWY